VQYEVEYRNALAGRRLDFARCEACGNAWLPASRECPSCLAARWKWQSATGRGILISWCVYHIAYTEALKERLPYIVAVVELEEGPRLITNIVDSDPAELTIDAPVVMDIQSVDGVPTPLFRAVADCGSLMQRIEADVR